MSNIMLNYLLLFVSIIVVSVAQIIVSASYSKYKKVNNCKKVTGFDVARSILDKNGMKDVYITEVQGKLADHYDPKRKVVRLSSDIYHGTSIASASVAAHEVGHAIQDRDGYLFMRIRSAMVPLVNFASFAGYFAIMIGLIFGFLRLFWIGIILELVILLFQLVTLPVELDASRRGKNELISNNLVDEDDLSDCSKMLAAAAFTYVASLLSTLLEILRLVLMAKDRD